MALAPTAMLVAQEAETKPAPKDDDIEIIEVGWFKNSSILQLDCQTAAI